MRPRKDTKSRPAPHRLQTGTVSRRTKTKVCRINISEIDSVQVRNGTASPLEAVVRKHSSQKHWSNFA